MKLTPLDIHHKEFRNSLRGYNSEEVDDFLDEVADEFERLFKENIDLNEKLDVATERVRSYGELEHTLQNTLVSAQTSAEDIVGRARKDAERLLRDAEAKAQEIVSLALEEKQHSQAEYTRLQAAEEEFRARFRRMLEGYISELAPDPAGKTAVVADPAPPSDRAPAGEPQLRIETPVVEEPVVPMTVAETAEETEAPTGEVVSLTLGEVEDPAAIEDDIPTLDIPAEFTFPKTGPVGELDDDIEEID